MFTRKYKGQAATEFCDALQVYDQIYDPERYFGRFIAILQSSGTGKSRLVSELLNTVYLYYVLLLSQLDKLMRYR